jgi:butyrate kinase
MMSFTVLVINPGSTSTKIALYEDDNLLWDFTIRHSVEELDKYSTIPDQLPFRLNSLLKTLEDKKVDVKKLSAVVGRGGAIKPIPGGTYLINDILLEDSRVGVQAQHASNLGSLLAYNLAKDLNIPSYIVDPVAVDEFDPIARISGIPEIKRRSLSHALNLRAVAHRVAKNVGKNLKDLNMVVVHLGGGISVCPFKKGRMVDVNNANEMGPFSPERTGGLPVGDLMKVAFSGQYTLDELKKILTGKGGLVAYLGTNSAIDVEKMIDEGNKEAELIYNAMAYQVAKEIGAMATVLNSSVDYIVLTGGLANSKRLTNNIKEYVEFLSEVLVYPGEDELQALVEGVLRVLRGQEKHKIYQ